MGIPSSLSQVKRSEKYSDLKLICQGKEFLVHKIVVCTQSSVLAAACEGDFQEAKDGSIHMTQFDYKTLGRMIDFMYTSDYDVLESEMSRNAPEATFETLGIGESLAIEKVSIVKTNHEEHFTALARIVDDDEQVLLSDFTEPSHVSTLYRTLSFGIANILLNHIRMNAIGDYYDLPLLRHTANEKIKEILETNWSAEGFSDVIKEAFDSTRDESLHNMLTSATATHIEELLERPEFSSMELMSDFTLGALRSVLAENRAKNDLLVSELREAKNELLSAETVIASLNEECLSNKMEALTETSRAGKIIEDIGDCLKFLSITERCRNSSCLAAFACYVEVYGQSDRPQYTIRCGKCRCKHN